MRSLITRNRFASLALAGLLAVPLSLPAAAQTTGKPYLGVGIEATAKEADQSGVTLREVAPEGPGGNAGLKTNDRIVMADGKEVKTFADLTNVLASHKPGDPVALKVVRNGKEETFTVTLGEAPESFGRTAPLAPKSRVYLGVRSQALTAELKEHLGLSTDKGALVTEVLPNSPAARAGLQEEDVITHAGDAAVTTPEELRDAIQKAGTGQEMALKVVRGKQEMELKARLQEAPAAADFPGWLPERLEGFGHFSGKLRPFFLDMEKVPALEKKIQELENRVRELEQQRTK